MVVLAVVAVAPVVGAAALAAAAVVSVVSAVAAEVPALVAEVSVVASAGAEIRAVAANTTFRNNQLNQNHRPVALTFWRILTCFDLCPCKNKI